MPPGDAPSLVGARPGAGAPGLRTLAVAGVAHALHDGYTDTIYVLLPLWQVEFGLGYGRLALMRGLYAGAMACLQVPAGRMATLLGGRMVLAAGTALAALGYALAGGSAGVIGLSFALLLAGAGGSVQHPIGAGAVSRAYGGAARGPLGIYNFSGDLGKAAVPAAISLVLVSTSWRHALWGLSLLGLSVAAGVLAAMPAMAPEPAESRLRLRNGPRAVLVARASGSCSPSGCWTPAHGWGCSRSCPFSSGRRAPRSRRSGSGWRSSSWAAPRGRLRAAGSPRGWACSARCCSPRAGPPRSSSSSSHCRSAPALVVLPLLGTMLNGTSSVLYGTVPELRSSGSTESSFALFYTGVIGAGAAAPIAFGVLGDAAGPAWATVATAATALATVPLAVALASVRSAPGHPFPWGGRGGKGRA